MPELSPLHHLPSARFETPAILKQLAKASRKLAELKGVASSIPNQAILVNTLGMQEAKDSSAIENIVTTHDELFKDDAFPETLANPAAKEDLHADGGGAHRR
jgi:Fic family protein